jgi:pimeloyl-ACP methyl ester carboxylesterase
MRRWYGANPLHLLVLLGCFALAGYAAAQLVPSHPLGVAIWFLGAVAGHDLLLMPLYSLADRSAIAALRHRVPRLPLVPWINYVRVPAGLSALLLLVWLPLILRLHTHYHASTTLSPNPYLWHWLAVTGALFLLSAAAFAARLRGATDPGEPSAPAPPAARAEQEDQIAVDQDAGQPAEGAGGFPDGRRSMEITPFRIEIPEADLADLRERLRRTRWPEAETVSDWSQGVPLAYLRDLCRYWASEYDWRATEARLNALPQFRTEIGGLPVHFIHARSPHPEALPLILTHGWPGSVIEFLKVIEPLTLDAQNPFHVVCPSLPGYGFSGKPDAPGWGIERIATAWAELMARLGYARYGAQGSDWGTSITTLLARQDLGHVAGIHLTPPLAPPVPSEDLTESEQAALASLRHSAEWDSGYSTEHATRPQTIGYALTDSPAALAAWILEKFWAWTDHDGALESVLTRDELLDNLMLYWLPRTGTSAARLYWESIRQVNQWITGEVSDLVTVPTGCSIFPKELQRPSRRWAQRRFTNIRYWNEPARGGHFAAFEQPELFVTEVRAFFRLIR